MSAKIIQWRTCQRFPNYEVSENGDVRRCIVVRGKLGGPVSPYLDKGYKRYRLRQGGRYWCVSAHQLVAEGFIGPKPFDGAEVCHNDGVKLNVHYSNLRWDTHKANHQDRIKHGTSNRGEKNGISRVTPAEVIEIRSRYAKGEMQRDLAKEFGLTPPAVSMIVTRKNWNHVQ